VPNFRLLNFDFRFFGVVSLALVVVSIVSELHQRGMVRAARWRRSTLWLDGSPGCFWLCDSVGDGLCGGAVPDREKALSGNASYARTGGYLFAWKCGASRSK